MPFLVCSVFKFDFTSASICRLADLSHTFIIFFLTFIFLQTVTRANVYEDINLKVEKFGAWIDNALNIIAKSGAKVPPVLIKPEFVDDFAKQRKSLSDEEASTYTNIMTTELENWNRKSKNKLIDIRNAGLMSIRDEATAFKATVCKILAIYRIGLIEKVNKLFRPVYHKMEAIGKNTIGDIMNVQRIGASELFKKHIPEYEPPLKLTLLTAPEPTLTASSILAPSLSMTKHPLLQTNFQFLPSALPESIDLDSHPPSVKFPYSCEHVETDDHIKAVAAFIVNSFKATISNVHLQLTPDLAKLFKLHSIETEYTTAVNAAAKNFCSKTKINPKKTISAYTDFKTDCERFIDNLMRELEAVSELFQPFIFMIFFLVILL